MNPQDPNQPNEQPLGEAPAAPTPEATPINEAPVQPASNPFGPAPAPAATEAPASPLASQAPAPKKSNKKIALIAGIIGGLVLLGGIGAGVFLSLKNVSAADYKTGYDQLVVVRNAVSAAPTVSGVDGSADEKLEEGSKLLETYKTENAKLADLKAFKGDDELKEKYTAYKTKSEAYIAYTADLLPAVAKLAEARDKIKDLGTGTALYTTPNVQKIIDAYKEVATVSNPSIKAFADTAVSVYTEILPQAAILEASGSTAAQKNTAIRAVNESTRKLTAQSRVMSDELSAKSKEVSIRESLNDLGDATTKKYNDKR